MTQTIAIIAEHCNHRISPSTLALLAAAAEIKAYSGAGIRLIIAGDAVEPMAEKLACHTGCPVLGLELGGSDGYLEERSAAALIDELSAIQADFICMAHSVSGASLAGRLAVRLDGACITGVEGIINAADGLHFKRSTHGGKFVATVAAETPRTILTIQPGAFQPPESTSGTQPAIEIKRVEPAKSVICRSGRRDAVAGADDLINAKVVVAAGQGIAEPENIALIRRLAACFSNSAVAGTRIVCDLGWLNYNRQVGASGNSVSPDLYFACGISGAEQHLAGMRGSRFVVAVNTDPNAAIFREADVCIVEDLKVFLPALVAALERRGPNE